MNPTRFGLLALVVALFAGCAPAVQVVSVVPEPAGANCPNGGLAIETGTDTNHNGTLDSSEVTNTTYACNGSAGTNGTDGTNGTNGTNGTSFLTTTTVLSPGDVHCLDGGVEIDSGMDTNADGTLESSEITSTQYVCNGVPQFTVKPIDPPPGPPGAYTIQGAGGTGSTGAGGAGAGIQLQFDVGTLGGHAKIFATGQADASFTVPSAGTPWMGDHPYEVTADTTVKDYATGQPSTDGELYTQNTGLYTWDASSSARVPVSALTVDAGVTLTFTRDDDTQVVVIVPETIDNAGTITTTPLSDGVSRHDLVLLTSFFQGETGSLIDLTGAAGSSAAGGNGGSLDIETTNGSIFDAGDVHTTGGDGTVGGAGGQVQLMADYNVFGTGSVEASGGAGSAGAGGAGGAVTFQAAQGHLWSSSAITASGGDGSTAGGIGGAITLTGNDGVDDVRNQGDLDSHGGDVTDSGCTDTSCSGGKGGSIELDALGGRLVTSGKLTSHGGVGVGGRGGKSGEIDFNASDGTGPGGAPVPSGDIVVSGDILCEGGDGAKGGRSSGLVATLDEETMPLSQEIIFLGYTDIHAEGGDGATNGGNGGALGIENYNSADANGIQGPSGGAINYANLWASGGNGTTGLGGTGGSLDMETEYNFGYMTSGEVMLNYGSIDIHGGDGVGGGSAGYIFLSGTNRAENYGPWDAAGGTNSADGILGRAPSQVWMGSDLGPVLNQGDINGTGGAATGSGSVGGMGVDVEFHGRTSVKNTGALELPGGAANMTDGIGGPGGEAILEATAGTATNLGDVSILGGAGATAGGTGTIWVNGQDISSTYLP